MFNFVSDVSDSSPMCPRATEFLLWGKQFSMYVCMGLHHIWSGGLSGDWAHSSHSFFYWSCLCERSDFIPHQKVMLFGPTCTGGLWGEVGVFFSSVQHDDVRLGEMETWRCSMTLSKEMMRLFLKWSDFATVSYFLVAGAAAQDSTYWRNRASISAFWLSKYNSSELWRMKRPLIQCNCFCGIILSLFKTTIQLNINLWAAVNCDRLIWPLFVVYERISRAKADCYTIAHACNINSSALRCK